jgi:hypothetical protein
MSNDIDEQHVANLALYEKLVATIRKVERKGKTMRVPHAGRHRSKRSLALELISVN